MLFIFSFMVFILDLSFPIIRASFVCDFFTSYLLSLFPMFSPLIVINGSYFFDGLNGLTLGYFFSLLLILFNLAEFKVLISND